MDDSLTHDEEAPKRKSRLPLLVGVILAVAGGCGGYLAVSKGVLGGHAKDDAKHQAHSPDPIADVAFLPVDQIVVTLPRSATARHLRFRAQLEVASSHAHDVEKLMPRVVDVLNGYLRALDGADIEGDGALIRLRSQMLRRVQLVTGPGRVRDLLIMEFVLT
ncbi:flagellar basal body-associated FliL family protein [Shimia biformata]|uniref:flagellar basal body-associated FliL family protein n=1 Tax=Shimia biformata TaxID=1294299 RepID=UPI0019513214|nr:flagellar basal body-associated FliL family protein [Shimia biformata]